MSLACARGGAWPSGLQDDAGGWIFGWRVLQVLPRERMRFWRWRQQRRRWCAAPSHSCFERRAQGVAGASPVLASLSGLVSFCMCWFHVPVLVLDAFPFLFSTQLPLLPFHTFSLAYSARPREAAAGCSPRFCGVDGRGLAPDILAVPPSPCWLRNRLMTWLSWSMHQSSAWSCTGAQW